MEPHTLFSALSSKTRWEILRILSSGPKHLMDVKSSLNASGIRIKYRESVYRALEKLVSAGLVDKFYDSQEKRIKYALAIEKIELDVRAGKIITKSARSKK